MIAYYCHICGAPLDYPGRCQECGERPIYDWMDDDKLKEEDKMEEEQK